MKTMRDIAIEAGVSRTTVSFVLNGRNDAAVRIPEETRRRVLDVAHEMGYQRNELVRAVVSGKNRMLGFLGFHSRFESAARVLEGVINEAESHEFTIKVLPVGENHVSEPVRAQCIRLRLAGVIVLNPGGRDLNEFHGEMARYQIPMVVGDDAMPQPWGIRVTSDDQQGVGLAIEHLAQLGHRRIAFIAGQRNSPISIAREAGFRAAMQRLGLPMNAESVVYSDWNNDLIVQGTRRLLQGRERVTAIANVTDDTAMVVLRTIRAQGLSVPKDVSVVGYADLGMSELADPPLTTVAQPFEAMGRRIVRHLIGRVERNLEKYGDEPIEDLLATRLVVRQSTASAPAVAGA